MKFGSVKKIKCMLALLFLYSPKKRAKYLKKHKIFYQMGEECSYASRKIPSEPYLVKIGNNVRIAANVTFVTHDVISSAMSRAYHLEKELPFHMGTIEIGNDVVIGTNVTILYGVKVGEKCILAAGAVVTKDVEPGTIVGGNPAHVIGRTEDLVRKRIEREGEGYPSNHDDIETICAYFWGDRS